MKHRDLTTGTIWKNILYLALPTMFAMLLQTSFNIVDTIYVGRISAQAIAAISLTFPVVFLMISLASGIGIGTTSFIARLIGAKQIKKASEVAKHALLISLFLYVLFCTTGLIFGRQLFLLMGASQELLPLVLSYANIIFIGSVFLFVAFIGNSILRGEGDMKTPMIVMAISAILNIILDPFLIFGIGFFPRLEVMGAALATVIARCIAMLYILQHLFKNKALVVVNFKDFKFDFSIIKEIFRVGIPSSLNQMAMSIGMILLIKITSLFGENAIAAYGLAFRLDGFAIMPIFGISHAILTIVGHNIGAHNIKRAKKTTWTGCLMASSFMGFFGILFFLNSNLAIRIFTNNLEVIAFGVSYLKIAALTYFFIAISVIIGASFQGAGKGIPALVLTFIRVIILAVPLAYIFSIPIGYEVRGIWLGIAVSNVLAGLFSILWFKIVNFRISHAVI